MTADIAEKEPKKAPGGNLSQQGWGTLKTRFRTWVGQVRAMGKDMLLVSHDKEDKDGDTRIVRPDIVGGSYAEVMKVADFVGYLQMSGKDRVLDFNPTDLGFPIDAPSLGGQMETASIAWRAYNEGMGTPCLLQAQGRYAPRHDALAFTLVEMAAAFAGLFVVAVAAGQLAVPHGWTVWGALVVTGVFASALAFLAQTWAQRRVTSTQTALAFSLEPVWTAFFGFTLAGDRLSATAWLGCAVIMVGIGLAEPAAAGRLGRLVRRQTRVTSP